MDVKAVAFDLDGTITKTNVSFTPFRERIGCGEGNVLDYIDKADGEERERYYRVLDEYEKKMQEDCELNPGFTETMHFLDSNGIKTGIVTRSSRNHAEVVVRKLGIPIKYIMAREDAEPKPSGMPLIMLSKMLDVPTEKMLFIGDFLWDMLAGKNAGVKTVLLLNEKSKKFAHLADYTVERLDEIIGIIKGH